MSPGGSSAAARARSQPEVETRIPYLRLVAARPFTAARLPFAIFVGAILVVGLVALLLLHTMAAQDAFRLQALERSSAALADTEEQLQVANQQQEAPSTLGARARALGMVATGSIAYVDLHRHGKIVGVVRAAQPPPPPPAPAPSASPSASSSASPNASPNATSAKTGSNRSAKPATSAAKNTPKKHSPHSHG